MRVALWRWGHALYVTALTLFLCAPNARAQALRRFEEPRKTPPSSGSSGGSSGSASGNGSRSSSGSSSSSSSGGSGGAAASAAADVCGSICSVGLQAMFSGLFSGNGTSSAAPSSASTDPTEEPTASTYPAAFVYDSMGVPHTYVVPWRKLHDDAGGTLWLIDKGSRRYADVGLTLFAPLNERVFSAEVAARAYLKYFVIGAAWERFVEPLPRQQPDTLDLAHLRVGGNVFGGNIPSVELYPLLGATLFSGPTVTTGGFNMGLEARAYPLRPLAVQTSFAAIVFGQGKPLFDTRLELGLGLGRVDVRMGLRYLFQEPAQSFLGPTLALLVRL